MLCNTRMQQPHRPFSTSKHTRRCSLSRCRSIHVKAAQSTVQFPPYSILQSGNGYDLRFYDVHTVVQVPYEKRDEGYDALGSYFDGRNADGIRFAESQPVTMTYNPDGSKTMQLYLGITLAGEPTPVPAPLPTNPRVRLQAAGGEVVAVLRFEGFITPESARQARSQLISMLERDGLKLAAAETDGMFRVAQYGPLYSLGRLNDMMLAVSLT